MGIVPFLLALTDGVENAPPGLVPADRSIRLNIEGIAQLSLREGESFGSHLPLLVGLQRLRGRGRLRSAGGNFLKSSIYAGSLPGKSFGSAPASRYTSPVKRLGC